MRHIFSQLRAAVELWDLVKNDPYPTDRFLGNYFHLHRKKFGSRDRRFLSEIIYSLFRNRTYLEAWAAASHETGSLFVVFMAIFLEDLLPLPEWSESLRSQFPKIDTEKLATALKAKELPPEIQKQKLPRGKEWSLKYSFPEWLVTKWIAQFGEEETQLLLESAQVRPPFVIRANTLKASRDSLLETLNQKGWQVSKTERTETGILFKERANLFDSEEFQEGFFEVQDEGSQLVCEMIDAKPGELVWDVCAGGGGKSLAIAARMQNKGRIIATDIRQKKLDDLRKRAKRAGVMTIFPADLERMEEIHAIRKGVDKIVVDAPCSGTGTLRRNPDAKGKLKPEIFLRNQLDQIEIVEKSLPRLKVGGKLFYITCSLEPEENEQVMQKVLERHPELQIVPYPRSREGYFRLFPHKHETDGFFLAIAEKTK